MDKTFAAIEKLKEVELELHRLKNALEMMNRAYDAKKEWVGLTEEEVAAAWAQSKGDVLQRLKPFACAIEAALKAKNAQA